MTAAFPSKRLVWTLLLLFLASWLYMLGARTLVPTDEGRYAEMAREMLATNDWITPRLNGIKYFEKPPLQNWMNALTFAAFGLGEWQARLWTGLCGLLGIGLVAYTGRRIFDARTGFYAGVILASSFFWAALSHVNTLDMGLAGMMTISLCALLLAQREDADRRARRNWMLVCWAGMALAVLSKGLIGIVLPGGVLVAYTLVQRDFGLWTRLHLGAGLLVFFAITTPWFVLVSLQNPEFPHFFFIHEHLQRFTSKVHNRAGPWYYFIPILALGILPWLGVIFQGLLHGWRQQPEGRFNPNRMLLLWAVVIFAFFSVSGSKLPSYIIPIFPALALLIGGYLNRAGTRPVMAAAGLVLLLCAVGLAFVPRIALMGSEEWEKPLYQGYAWWVAAGAIIGLLGSIYSLLLARRRNDYAMVALAVAGYLAGQVIMLGHEPLGRYAAGIAHVPALQAELAPDTTLYSVGRYEQALPFYLQRTLTLVEHADEMAFGLGQEPHRWVPTRAEFVQRWRAAHAANRKEIAIMSPTVYRAMLEQKLPMRVIGQDPRRVIVTNQPAAAGNRQ
ncbi:glycosyltransferase family 39 protein [Lacisediminimonas profundi]|uniref:glycosyltransferase family 39 protein n=1 Tax=Lacisediminimonas profundi TaxID=2603856 RepID=UPI00124AF341|nr:glycosyltransferase family 39 protein [Lacisediminimonas profundi]